MNASPMPARGLCAATLLAALALPASTDAAGSRPVADSFRQLHGTASPLLTPGPAPTLERIVAGRLRAERVGRLRMLRQLQARRDAQERRELRTTLVRLRRAGNRIATRPYVWGGGHGSFKATGYDCSGSVSYVLHGAGLLDAPLASGGLATYGEPGPGKHVTIYANGGHVFMTINGRRYDTSAMSETAAPAGPARRTRRPATRSVTPPVCR